MNQPVSPYAPATADPLRLASVTVKAVSQIGNASAAEIEQVAASIEAGAKELADRLRRLATQINEHSQIAHEHVGNFVNKATSAIETMRQLEEMFNPPAAPEKMPAVVTEGPQP